VTEEGVNEIINMVSSNKSKKDDAKCVEQFMPKKNSSSSYDFNLNPLSVECLIGVESRDKRNLFDEQKTNEQKQNSLMNICNLIDVIKLNIVTIEKNFQNVNGIYQID
jgi:hypothetical protein